LTYSLELAVRMVSNWEWIFVAKDYKRQQEADFGKVRMEIPNISDGLTLQSKRPSGPLVPITITR
jgi:hypothetical protein